MKLDFSGRKVLVVGDVMLDQYAHYVSTGQSPEAPIPVLKENGNILNSLGGAANVAANLRALGVDVALSGVIGNDEEAEILLSLLREHEIKDLTFRDSRPTTRKRRILAASKSHPPYQITRLDRESTDPIPNSLEWKATERLCQEMQNTNAVVFSDYSKGFLTDCLIEVLKREALNRHIPIIVDAKPSRLDHYEGSTLFKPNVKEMEGLTGLKYTSPKDKSRLEEIGASLFQKLNPKYILFTLGDDGMVLYTSPTSFEYISAIKVENADVSGAGDTVNAALAACLASGYSPLDSARVANHAASIVVGKRGTAICSIEELVKTLDH